MNVTIRRVLATVAAAAERQHLAGVPARATLGGVTQVRERVALDELVVGFDVQAEATPGEPLGTLVLKRLDALDDSPACAVGRTERYLASRDRRLYRLHRVKVDALLPVGLAAYVGGWNLLAN